MRHRGAPPAGRRPALVFPGGRHGCPWQVACQKGTWLSALRSLAPAQMIDISRLTDHGEPTHARWFPGAPVPACRTGMVQSSRCSGIICTVGFGLSETIVGEQEKRTRWGSFTDEESQNDATRWAFFETPFQLFDHGGSAGGDPRYEHRRGTTVPRRVARRSGSPGDRRLHAERRAAGNRRESRLVGCQRQRQR